MNKNLLKWNGLPWERERGGTTIFPRFLSGEEHHGLLDVWIKVKLWRETKVENLRLLRTSRNFLQIELHK